LIYHADDYAEYFNLNEAQLKQCADSQLVTVYHDDHGHIIRLENQITQNNG
jgi:biofilm PGA synthesis protein PgaD